LIPAVLSLVYGFGVRPFWGISKILATPSWTAICSGISFAVFALIYYLGDILHHTRWANFLMPAGRSALTCYLVPGLVYPFLWPLQQMLPQSFLTGWIGLIKSLLFALLIIALTGFMEKFKIRLKI
jgi:predicted acyltransferase